MDSGSCGKRGHSESSSALPVLLSMPEEVPCRFRLTSVGKVALPV